MNNLVFPTVWSFWKQVILGKPRSIVSVNLYDSFFLFVYSNRIRYLQYAFQKNFCIRWDYYFFFQQTTLILFQVILILFSNTSQADTNQFKHWYKFYDYTIRHTAGSCFSNYTTNYWPLETDNGDDCKKMAICLLSKINPFDQADMLSATVLLGLMPTALAYFGPSVNELALLSFSQPILAFLMVLGAPVMSVTRFFEFTSANEILDQDRVLSIPKGGRHKTILISICQYIFTALTVINSLANSITLGNQTILSWKCNSFYMQLIWNLMPLIPFFFATLSILFSKVSDKILLQMWIGVNGFG